MAGNGRRFDGTTVILYSVTVTKEHAFHRSFSGLCDQHPVKASQHISMLESTKVVYFLWRTGCESLQLLISQNNFLYVDPVFYVCESLYPEIAFSCDFYRVGTKPRVILCSWVQYIYSLSNGLADSKTMQ